MATEFTDFLWATETKILVIGGICGAISFAMVSGEPNPWKRLTRGIAAVMTAVFLGPTVANVLEPVSGSMTRAFFAGSYLCGFGGEAITTVFIRVAGGKK